ncbi:MAG: SEC-C domain-containing protein [Planctomycetaceae bacterium]|jgi:hypothetical protein|nr:SEC-C domain-containing protein [Planctomycetaceae bacterium]
MSDPLMQTVQNALHSMTKRFSGDIVDIERDVKDLRNKLSDGLNYKRSQLVDRLSDLALVYASAERFDEALEIMTELLEHGKLLANIDKTKDFGGYALKIGQVPTMTRMITTAQGTEYNRLEDMFNLYRQWMILVPENEFDRMKNEWALNNYEYAQHLLDKRYVVRAIEILKETLNTIEERHDPLSTKFNDWKPVLDGYRHLADAIKIVGDRTSALQKYIRYDEIADKAHNIIVRSKSSAPVSFDRGDARVIFGRSDEDMIAFMASYGFEEERFTTLIKIGDICVELGERSEGLKYYDKAGRVGRYAMDNDDFSGRHGFGLEYSEGLVPYKKAAIYYENKDIEAAQKQIQLADKIIQDKLVKNQKFYKEELRELYNEIRELKRKIFGVSNKTQSETAAAVAEKEKEKEPADRFGIRSGNFNMGKFIKALAEKSNEACVFIGKAQIEYERGLYKSAIYYLLQSRNILDSYMISLQIISTKSNLVMTCMLLGQSYLRLHEMEKSEKWFKRAIKHANFLENRINELKNKPNKNKSEEIDWSHLQRVDCTTLLILLMDNTAELYITMRRFKETLALLERGYVNRNLWFEKNAAIFNKPSLYNDMNAREVVAASFLPVFNVLAALEECCCSLGYYDEAIKWGKNEIKTHEDICIFLSVNRPISCTYRTKADISMAAALFCAGKIEQAEEIIQKITKLFFENNVEKNIEQAKERVDTLVALRRCALMSNTEFPEERDLLIKARKLMTTDANEAVKIYNDVLDKLKQKQKNAENSHRIIQKQWELTIKYTNAALNYCNGDKKDWNNMLLASVGSDNVLKNLRSEDKGEIDLELIIARKFDRNLDFKIMTEREPEGIDEKIAKHDIDFEDTNENPVAPEYELLQVEGDKVQSKLINAFKNAIIKTKFDPDEGNTPKRKETTIIAPPEQQTGRNDPCPCGSGKKYKKCCMNKK